MPRADPQSDVNNPLRDVPRVALARHWPQLHGTALPERLIIENEWTGLAAFSPKTRRHELVLEAHRYRGVFIARVGGMSSAAGQIARRETRAESSLPVEQVRMLLEKIRALQIVELPSDTWNRTRRSLLWHLASNNGAEFDESFEGALLELHFGPRTLRLERNKVRSPWWVMDDGPLYPIAGQALDRTFEEVCSGLDESAFNVLERSMRAAVEQSRSPESEEARRWWEEYFAKNPPPSD